MTHQDIRMFTFTCPTCGEERCQVFFSHPFDPKSVGAVLGFSHFDSKTDTNDPTGFIACGLVADLDKMKIIDDCVRLGKSAPKEVMDSVVRGNKPPKPKRLMAQVRFICPFCQEKGRTAFVDSDHEHIIHSSLPDLSDLCDQFQQVLDDRLEADEFLKAARLRMSE